MVLLAQAQRFSSGQAVQAAQEDGCKRACPAMPSLAVDVHFRSRTSQFTASVGQFAEFVIGRHREVLDGQMQEIYLGRMCTYCGSLLLQQLFSKRCIWSAKGSHSATGLVNNESMSTPYARRSYFLPCICLLLASVLDGTGAHTVATRKLQFC